MVVTVADMIDTLKGINILEEAAAALEDSGDLVKDKQRDQLLHGIRADGKKIGKYRSRKYAAVKNAKNPLAGLGNMDWKLTGSLHKEVFLDVRTDDYVLDSADPKTGGLIGRFGDPFGLTEDSEDELINEKLEDAFITRIEKKTGL